jgi:hypothetical protein
MSVEVESSVFEEFLTVGEYLPTGVIDSRTKTVTMNTKDKSHDGTGTGMDEDTLYRVGGLDGSRSVAIKWSRSLIYC